MKLQQEVTQLFTDKKYEDVIPKCDEMSKLFPEEPSTYYNKACALARLGRAEDAFQQLAVSVEKGFGAPAHMQRDEDLESLRKDKRFDELVEKARENERKMDGEPEAGAEMQGVKTVEDLPEGGLRYRLRMSPNATKEKPNRLIVWLHPSGGSMNRVVEALAPRFIEKGFALAVMTQKTWAGWNDRDAQRLLNVTLPALAKVEGLDARKPLLLGYSAGGQVALLLWQQDPARWGGVILDAAYPVIIAAPTQITPMKIPEVDAVKQVPIFVLVGEQDGGANTWRQAAPRWRKAGIPVRVDYVADMGHTWLFGKFQLAALDAWLADVAAGKTPEVPEDKPVGNKPAAVPENPDQKPQPPEFNE
jgi:predicted esterase